MKFKDISFCITYSCQSMCKNCQLWQMKKWNPDDEISLKKLEKNLFSDETLSELKTCHLTGGMPHLHPKFLNILKLIKEYLPTEVRANQPLEGMFPKLYKRVFKRAQKILPQYRLDLAIEGPTKEIHEQVRPQSWETTFETEAVLKALGVDYQWEMTIYPENYKYIKDVYAMTDGNIYLNFGRDSVRFGNERQGLRMWPVKEQVYEIEDQLRFTGWLTKRPLNAQKWLLQKNMWLGKEVRWDCFYGQKSVDIQPNGEVFPCLQYPEGMSMGSLKQKTLTGIVNSKKYRRRIKEITAGDCQTGTGCPFTLAMHIDDIKIEE